MKTIIKFDRSDNESSSLFIEESKKYRKFILKFPTRCHIDRYLIFFVVLIPYFEPFLRGLFSSHWADKNLIKKGMKKYSMPFSYKILNRSFEIQIGLLIDTNPRNVENSIKKDTVIFRKI